MKNCINILFFSLLIFFQQVFHAQNPVVDSLKLELKSVKNDTSRIKILLELSDVCELKDVLLYAEPVKVICEDALKKESLNSHLLFFYNKYLAITYNNMGIYYSNNNEGNKALFYYTKSIKLSELINDTGGIADSYNNIGLVYDNIGDIEKALDYYHKSLKLKELIKDEEGIATCLNNIGGVFKDQGYLDLGLNYFLKSLALEKKNNDKKSYANSLNNIGTVYSLKGDLIKEIEYCNESLKISEEINDQAGVSLALGNLSSAYRDLGDLNKGLDLCYRSLEIQKKLNERVGVAYSLHNIGYIFLLKGKIIEAYDYCSRGLKEAKLLGYPSAIKSFAKTVKEICKKQNKFKEALEMYELEIQMRDSTNNEITKKASIKKQFQYEYEKQAAADSVKHAEEQKVKNAQLTAQSASLKQERTQRYALYGGLFLVIGFSGFVFNRFRVTQKQKKVIEEQKVLVDAAYEQLHEKNKEVMDSIKYAKRIQRALITSENYINKQLNRLIKNS